MKSSTFCVVQLVAVSSSRFAQKGKNACLRNVGALSARQAIIKHLVTDSRRGRSWPGRWAWRTTEPFAGCRWRTEVILDVKVLGPTSGRQCWSHFMYRGSLLTRVLLGPVWKTCRTKVKLQRSRLYCPIFSRFIHGADVRDIAVAVWRTGAQCRTKRW